MKKLSASILSSDFGRLAEQVKEAENAGVDWIHVDVMDGHFVPNITIGPAVTQALKQATALPLDVHLMISNPERYVEDFVRAGADWLGVHVEATVHLERLIQQIKEAGAKATVTLNPATPLDCLEYVLQGSGHGAVDDGEPRLFRPEIHPRGPPQSSAAAADD